MCSPESSHLEQDGSVSSTALSQPQSPYQPDSRFMDLSLDLITMVFDDIKTAQDSIAFSLACRGLYDAFFAMARARFNKANQWDKLNTQLMLEKTAPTDHVYCVFCLAIHTVDKEYCRTSCRHSENAATFSFDRQLVGEGTRKLRFLDARVVLNAMWFKRPEADKLRESLGWRSVTRTDKTQWIHQAKAKIVSGNQLFDPDQEEVDPDDQEVDLGDQELYLTMTSTHIHPERPFDEFTYSVCKHVHIYAKYPSIFAKFNLFDGGGCTGNDAYAGSVCNVCHARWTVRMEWVMQPEQVAREGWVLKIWSKHYLGSLRYPFLHEWDRCAGEYETPDVRELVKRPAREGGWGIIWQDFSRKPKGEQKAAS